MWGFAQTRTTAKTRVSVLVVVALISFLAVLLSWAAAARADGCTVAWTGAGGDGSWGTAANWSTDSVPNSSDEACLGTATITVTSGSYDVGSIQGPDAALFLTGGSLSLDDASTPSSLDAFVLYSGTLDGSGELDVDGGMYWGYDGTMSGSGSTVLESGSSSTAFFGPSGSSLDQRSLENYGTVDWYPGPLGMTDGATVTNGSGGTFDVLNNGVYADTVVFAADDASSTEFFNYGTFEKTEGSGEATVAVSTDNEGTATVSSGDLGFTGGGDGTGTWSSTGSSTLHFSSGSFSLDSGTDWSGTIAIDGAHVTADDLDGSDATLYLTAGTFTVTGSSPSALNALQFYTGTLDGSGELDVDGGMYWGYDGTMSGSGSTVLESGSVNLVYFGWTGSILDQRTLANYSTIVWYPGALSGSDGAVFENRASGTVDITTTGNVLNVGGGAAPLLSNLGALDVNNDGGTATIAWPADNEGVAEQVDGLLTFTGSYLPQPSAVAAEFEPILDFDSTEKWRPLNVTAFLNEQDPTTGDPWNSVCAAGGSPCSGLQGNATLASYGAGGAYMVFHDPLAGPDDAVSPNPSCVGPAPLQDCDTGIASVIYYQTIGSPGDLSPGGLEYINYGFFYRYNQAPEDAGNHVGDWEGVTVGFVPGASTFTVAEFSEHKEWKTYLRDNLECDNGGALSCGTEVGGYTGQHVMTFPAAGDHANYPAPGSGSVLPHPENGYNGLAPWGNNLNTSDLLQFPAVGPEGGDWLLGPQQWTDWPGRWGNTTPPPLPGIAQAYSPTSPAAPTPSGHGPHFFEPWTNLGGACPVGGACPSDVRREQSFSCGNWLGADVTAVACKQSALDRAVDTRALGRQGQFTIAASSGGRHAAAVPGLAQLMGSPLAVGHRLVVSGDVPPGTELAIAARQGRRTVTAVFANLVGFEGRGQVIVRRGAHGRPVVTFVHARHSVAAVDVVRS